MTRGFFSLVNNLQSSSILLSERGNYVLACLVFDLSVQPLDKDGRKAQGRGRLVLQWWSELFPSPLSSRKPSSLRRSVAFPTLFPLCCKRRCIILVGAGFPTIYFVNNMLDSRRSWSRRTQSLSFLYPRQSVSRLVLRPSSVFCFFLCPGFLVTLILRQDRSEVRQ